MLTGSIAGFELYTDFILADFLISCTPFVKEVVFRCVRLGTDRDLSLMTMPVPRLSLGLSRTYCLTISREPLQAHLHGHALTGPTSWAIDSLLNETFFADAKTPPTAEDLVQLRELARRWKGHLASGAFKLSVPTDTPLGADTPIGGFWTTQYAYQDMPAIAPQLVDELAKAGLVIFKGDLNYRK